MNKKKLINNRLKVLIISLFALFVGLFLYLIFNRQTYISSWVNIIVPESKLSIPQNFITSMITCFGADLLWSISFTMIVQFIIWCKKEYLFYLIFCSALGIIYELMQCSGITNGTADILDVIVYILGSLLAIIIIQGGKLYEEK